MAFSRQDYLDNRCTHRQYYGQMVTDHVRDVVRTGIGLDRLKKSTDPHFNDIPLQEWDDFTIYLEMGGFQQKIREYGDLWSLAGGVCILKEAARQLAQRGE